MRAAKGQASLRIHAVSPEPLLFTHTSSESRGTFRQKARSLHPLNGWACAVTICHDGMLEDINSLDGAQFIIIHSLFTEEEWKRYYESLSEGYKAVGFSYDYHGQQYAITEEGMLLLGIFNVSSNFV